MNRCKYCKKRIWWFTRFIDAKDFHYACALAEIQSAMFAALYAPLVKEAELELIERMWEASK
jgi:hypothetical protein